MAKTILIDGTGCSIGDNHSAVVVALHETNKVTDYDENIAIETTTSDDPEDPGTISVARGSNIPTLYKMNQMSSAIIHFLQLADNLEKEDVC